ncbi:oligosaccharide flippase family protein [Thiocapsa marina]|uniref:Polysaccharide biosynthesis protein n=1 Tax=Thiocapsa marina 5811 TaxID=768671 RepID=F9UII7_9GAMM|nr:oligosaccharide flippase family protein [Thiocapsa marina]EGV15969.1 hypothetical protein ThimaDRAFT_4740 [Thiocapsa marina 5811]
MKQTNPLKRLTHSPLARNILTLFTGKAAAQVILIGSAPIISRLFVPADYGTAAMILALAALVAPLATLSFGTASQLAALDSDARSLLRVAMGSTVLFTVLLVALTFILSSALELEFFTRFGGWEWAIPLLFLLHGAESAFESWNTRRKRFKVQAVTSVSSVGISTGSRIAFGAIGGSSVAGLVISKFIGVGTRVAVLARGSGLTRSTEASERSLDHYRSLAYKFRDFPLFATPTALLQSVNRQLPLLLFGGLFSPAVAGLYAMADRLFLRPLNLLNASFRSVYTQHLVSAVDRGRPLTPLLLKASAFTGAAMLVPSTLLLVYGEPMIAFVLGETWRGAGEFIEITAPLMFFAALVIPANAAMVVCRQQRTFLAMQVLTTTALAVGFFTAFLIWRTPASALWALVTVLSIRHLYTVFIALAVTRRQDKSQQSNL